MKKYLGNKLTKEAIIEQMKNYKMIFIEFNNYEKFIELFKAIKQLGYHSEWTEDEDMTSIMNLKVVKEDLKKHYGLIFILKEKLLIYLVSTMYLKKYLIIKRLLMGQC